RRPGGRGGEGGGEVDDGGPALVLPGAERGQVTRRPAGAARDVRREEPVDVLGPLAQLRSLPGVDRGAEDAVVDLARHRGGELARGAREADAGEEDGVVDLRARGEHPGLPGEEPEVGAVALAGEGGAVLLGQLLRGDRLDPRQPAELLAGEGARD